MMLSRILVAGGWLERDQGAPLAAWWWHDFGKRHILGQDRLQPRRVYVCFCDWVESSGTWAVGSARREGTMFSQGVCFSTFLIL